jgi:hypothetical protein
MIKNKEANTKIRVTHTFTEVNRTNSAKARQDILDLTFDISILGKAILFLDR